MVCFINVIIYNNFDLIWEGLISYFGPADVRWFNKFKQ